MKQRWRWVLISALLLGGCEAVDGAELTPPQDVTSPDGAVEVGFDLNAQGPDVPLAEITESDTFTPDADVGQPCQEGEGCFGESCGTGSDCLSGICTMHLGENVCSKTCDQTCPTGWGCHLVGQGSDGQYACVSRYSQLCLPCEDAGSCSSDQPTACVRYGGGMSFCGGSCSLEAPCPTDYACQEVETQNGATSYQCMHTMGVCPCGDLAVDSALSTPCEVTNEVGTCSGLRLCEPEGLSACSATVPAPEICNGIDDDCDGLTDESVCDDGNPCTLDTCTGVDGCANTALDAGECLDGDACTQADHCEAGVCVGEPLICNDGNECTDESCDPEQGCQYQPNFEDCDDGDPCTLGDSCKNEACAPGPLLKCDDNNPCTDEACGADGCVSSTNVAPCDDGNPCTAASLCFEGACLGTETTDCDDANACTTDGCVPAQGCLWVDNALPCDDGDICTQGDACTLGACGAGAASFICEDGNPCTTDSCDPVSGCQFTPTTAPCDDGNACTASSTCTAGACVGNEPTDCDDGNLCTTDGCVPAEGCISLNHSLPCDDGDVCTLGDTCDGGSCGSGALPLVCDDGNPCTTDLCDATAGCFFQSTQETCDDGNACTTDDTCVAGLCLGVGSLACDDTNPCTLDSCLPDGGCAYGDLEGPCSDGDTCTSNDVCVGGSCQSGPPLTCDDGNPCTDDLCTPSGCVFSANEAECDDGDICSASSTCASGSCVATEYLSCDDGNVCTDHGCDPGVGCVSTDNEAPCTDGDACTQEDTCSQGTCDSGPGLICDDGNPCTDDVCADGGCVLSPNTNDCDDQDACTESSACQAGSCKGQGSIVCDDGDVCTDDSCHPLDGCVTDTNSAPCSDADACTTNDVCDGGGCVSGPPLDCGDGDDCTTDACDADGGCQSTPITPCCGDGIVEGDEACDDGNESEADDCNNDCTAPPLVADWRIGTFNAIPVFAVKTCEAGDYYCQAEDACEQATGADCVWQQYNCTGYADENGSFYPTSNPEGKSTSTNGGSSLNWTVTSACSSGGSCQRGSAQVYGNLCCCDCPNPGQQWNESNNYCGVGIWDPY